MWSIIRDRRATALLLAATLTILSNTLISPALPGLLEAFRGQPRATLFVPLLVTAPSLAVAILAPAAGIFADRYGRRPQLLAGVLLFAIAGTAGLWLPSLIAILISRLALGVAVALVMTAQSALIGDYFAGEQRARFMGLQIASTNFGGFAMLMMAGQLADLSPFFPFAIYGVAALYLPVILTAIREPLRRIDAVSADADDRVPPRWLPTLGAVLGLAFLSLVGFYLVPTQLPFRLAALGQVAPSAAAGALGALSVVAGVSSMLYGHVRATLGRGNTAALGLFCFAVGFALLSVAGSFGPVLFACATIGGGSGLLFPILMSVPLDLAPATQRGLAAGAVTTSIFLGQFFSPVVGQPLVTSLGFPAASMTVAVVFALMSVLAAVILREGGFSPFRNVTLTV